MLWLAAVPLFRWEANHSPVGGRGERERRNCNGEPVDAGLRLTIAEKSSPVTPPSPKITDQQQAEG